MKFIKYLLLLVFILGGLPISQEGNLRAESASEQTKKKKRKKKKKVPAKNPLQIKRNPQANLKRKKEGKRRKNQKKKQNQKKLNQAKLIMIQTSQLQRKIVSILLHMRMSYLI